MIGESAGVAAAQDKILAQIGVSVLAVFHFLIGVVEATHLAFKVSTMSGDSR